MAWYDTKQAAVDPDNPAANEQIAFSEWNNMVTYLKDKIIDKTVDDAAIGDDKILVYKTATSTFVFETPSAAAALGDLTNVTISGVPADNEVLAYDTGTSEWINQTAAEAGLATTTDLASYLPLAGGTVAGALTLNGQVNMGAGLNMNDYYITGALGIQTSGGGVLTLNCDMNLGSHNISSVADPTLAQDAATKNYSDTRLLSKEAVTSFLDGYIPVYRTASGKFEMEDAGGSAGLPVADTTNIVKGSADGTKLMRFEVDGITTGTTRVMTVPDKDLTIADRAEVMLLDGTQAMSNDLDVGYNAVIGRHHFGPTDSFFNIFKGGIESTYSAELRLYGEDYVSHNGIDLTVPNAAKSSSLTAIRVYGVTDTPIVDIYYGLDMNAKDIHDIGKLILNDATELTIATGIVNVTQSHHEIDTEGEVATDDLDTVSGGSNGQILVLRAHDNARTVVVKDGTGNLQLAGDMTLDNILDSLTLIFDGTYWIELSRSNNSA